MAAQRALIVANQTLGGRELLLRVEHLNNPRGLTSFHIVVPATDGQDGGGGTAAAQRRLDAAARIITDLGAEVTGEVGPPDPLAAVRDVLARGEPFTEIIVSTQPPGISRWLHMDLPHRIGRLTHLPVEHVICTTEEDVTAMVADGDEAGGKPSWAAGDTPVRVLLVEDSATDVELTRIALERSSVPTEIVVATGGQEALQLLREPAGPPAYDVVLLDLKMPGMSGHEVLAALQGGGAAKHPPVVVLTTSALDSDRAEAHRLGAHAYILKEANFGHFQEVLEGVIREFASSRSSG
jgi:CheY-like chemotaxis protein